VLPDPQRMFLDWVKANKPSFEDWLALYEQGRSEEYLMPNPPRPQPKPSATEKGSKKLPPWMKDKPAKK
jgi:hypothetical protein